MFTYELSRSPNSAIAHRSHSALRSRVVVDWRPRATKSHKVHIISCPEAETAPKDPGHICFRFDSNRFKFAQNLKILELFRRKCQENAQVRESVALMDRFPRVDLRPGCDWKHRGTTKANLLTTVDTKMPRLNVWSPRPLNSRPAHDATLKCVAHEGEMHQMQVTTRRC
jgi:hypothetical protein